MKKILMVMALAIMLAWGVGTPQAEAYMIDFGIDYNSGNNGGSICYDSSSLSLIGSQIEIDNAVTGTGSLSFGASTTSLNFTMTGASDLGGGNFSFAGGAIKIVSNDTSVFGSATTLLSGTWDSSQVVSLYTLPDGTTKIVFGAFNDSKNEKLLTLLNIHDYGTGHSMIPGFTGGLNLQFKVPVDDLCSSEVYSGDVTNTSVPIPAAAIMLFSGLLGLFGVRRMRRDS